MDAGRGRAKLRMRCAKVKNDLGIWARRLQFKRDSLLRLACSILARPPFPRFVVAETTVVVAQVTISLPVLTSTFHCYTTPVDSYRYISTFQDGAFPWSLVRNHRLIMSLSQSNTAELAATYAALILADEGVEITVRGQFERTSRRIS
jgi:hypothetical protein